LLLATVAAISFFVAPDRSKDLWISISPILTGIVSGLVGCWASRSGNRERRAPIARYNNSGANTSTSVSTSPRG
jgi:hypothetical protein